MDAGSRCDTYADDYPGGAAIYFVRTKSVNGDLAGRGNRNRNRNRGYGCRVYCRNAD